jgi:hypothetical protein
MQPNNLTEWLTKSLADGSSNEMAVDENCLYVYCRLTDVIDYKPSVCLLQVLNSAYSYFTILREVTRE